MEAFGRMISLMCAMVGLVVCIVFYETASIGQQKNETVQSISNAFIQRTLKNQMISETEWNVFLNELGRLGTYETELTVLERRSFEGERKERYLFAELDEIRYGQRLSEGSYIRLVVTEKEKKTIEQWLYGGGGLYFAGGRIG
ncbi:MAG: hypothetical protein IJZ55_10595 [Lachnospiraceae bacterium]|nr:hypothetical protein [Lachnospiraceae bacterium]